MTKKLASLKPNVYLNEASSPLKRELLKKIREVKAAIPEKIKSTFIKNGIIHRYDVAPKPLSRFHTKLLGRNISAVSISKRIQRAMRMRRATAMEHRYRQYNFRMT